MAHRKKKGGKRQAADPDRRYRVRGVRREPLDVKKFSKALLGLVLADIERQAETDHEAEGLRSTPTPTKDEQVSGGVTDAQ